MRTGPPAGTRVDKAVARTKLGPLTVSMVDGLVHRVDFRVDFGDESTDRESQGAAADVARQIEEYLEGKRRVFDSTPDLSGLSPFTAAVLRELCDVPWGETCTYGEIAVAVGRPGAARAVGNACASNPIPIIVPCHRVLAAGGRLGGFGLGLDVKRALLAIEGTCRSEEPEQTAQTT